MFLSLISVLWSLPKGLYFNGNWPASAKSLIQDLTDKLVNFVNISRVLCLTGKYRNKSMQMDEEMI